MKVLLSWISDPCVHLIVIGLLLMRMMMGVGAEGESEELAARPTNCHVCGALHAVESPCPILAAQRFAPPSAH